jgi:hypothetical protein
MFMCMELGLVRFRGEKKGDAFCCCQDFFPTFLLLHELNVLFEL